MDVRLEGYQRLEQDFFRQCKIRGIRGEARVLLIYLRGLYCRFGKPVFYCPDKIIMEDLGYSKPCFKRLKRQLRKVGVIDYKPGLGRGTATEYLILNTELAPVIHNRKNFYSEKGSIVYTKGVKNDPFYLSSVSGKGVRNDPPIVIKSKDKSKVSYPQARQKQTMPTHIRETFQSMGML